MTSIALNMAHPDLFGGTLCVAGQWDPEAGEALADKNFWAIVSEDDAKAFPGMGAIMERVEATGTQVARGRIDARASKADIDAHVARIRADAPDAHVVFSTFTAGSVLPETGEGGPGAGHVNTWVYAYAIPALRDWLFEQRR